jgi:hypothetical protein
MSLRADTKEPLFKTRSLYSVGFFARAKLIYPSGCLTLTMNLRAILIRVAILALAAYGVSVLVHAVTAIISIYQTNYYVTGGGHAIQVAATVAIGFAVLCILPSIFLTVRTITTHFAKARKNKQ